MRKAIKQAFYRYGTTISVRKDGKTLEFRGFLQHTDSKSWQNMRGEFCALGEIPRGQFVLFAPANVVLSHGDKLKQGDKVVAIRTLERVMLGDAVLYQWGLCENVGGEDTWGSQS